MSTISTDEQYAWRVNPLPGQDHVISGETLISFRGETWVFKGVSRKAYGNSTGRVLVERFCPGGHAVGFGWECSHFWHENGIETREFFPSVFELYLGTEDGTEA